MRIDAELIADIRKPEKGQVIYRDDELIGFALRASKGAISWIVESRINGKLTRKTLGRSNQLSPEEARTRAEQMLGRMTSHRIHANYRIPTLSEVLEDYIGSRRLRSNTVRNYRRAVTAHLSDWMDLPVTAITKEMVLERHRELGNKMSGSFANQNMHVVKMLLFHAARRHQTPDGHPLLLSNPAKVLSEHKAWYRERRQQGVIPEHKLAAWYRALMAVSPVNIRDLLLLLLTTGLRRNEALTLRWCDVDLDSKTLTIREEISKNHREHKLPLSNFLMTLLSRRKVEHGHMEYVFPGRSDGHMCTEVHRVSKRVIAESNCPFAPHDLRRTFASVSANLGIPRHITKRLINHIGDKDGTEDYIIVSIEQLREPMEKINRRLLELMQADPELWGRYPEYKSSYRGITLEKAMEAFLKEHKLTAHTERLYRCVVEQRLEDWLDLPVTKITQQMVEERFNQISNGTSQFPASKCQANSTMKSLQAILNWVMDTCEVDGKPLLPSNPVRIMTQKRMWHHCAPRQKVVPDEELPEWYLAVMRLHSATRRDLLLLSVFAGLCLPDVRSLVWDDVDLEDRVLTIRAEGERLHRVPLSDVLLELFRQRKSTSKSQLVFPGRAGKPMRQFHEPTEQAWERGRFKFTQNDLRRTFLSVMQRLELSHYEYMALSNRGDRNSRWEKHTEYDMERLREPMQRISDRLLELMGCELPREMKSLNASVEVQSVLVVEEGHEEIYW